MNSAGRITGCHRPRNMARRIFTWPRRDGRHPVLSADRPADRRLAPLCVSTCPSATSSSSWPFVSPASLPTWPGSSRRPAAGLAKCSISSRRRTSIVPTSASCSTRPWMQRSPNSMNTRPTSAETSGPISRRCSTRSSAAWGSNSRSTKPRGSRSWPHPSSIRQRGERASTPAIGSRQSTVRPRPECRFARSSRRSAEQWAIGWCCRSPLL